MSVHDTQNPENRDDSLEAAVAAVRDGRLIVLPTDTVYGIGADAFTPDAVQALLDAKGRGRDTPPPVLVGDHAVLMALAVDVPEWAERLTEEFWPGALTLILSAQPSLTWDLGETRGTVALRMPDDETALELLRRTGPLAVSSANRHGKPAALTILDAATQLGDAVEIYLDGGQARIGTSSTIVDATVTPAVILREGTITREQIVDLVGDVFTAPEPEQDPEADPAEELAPGDEAAPAEGTEAGTGSGTAADGGTEAGTVGDSTPVTEGGAVSPSADEPASSAAVAPAAGSLDLPAESEITTPSPQLDEVAAVEGSADAGAADGAAGTPRQENPAG